MARHLEGRDRSRLSRLCQGRLCQCRAESGSQQRHSRAVSGALPQLHFRHKEVIQRFRRCHGSLLPTVLPRSEQDRQQHRHIQRLDRCRSHAPSRRQHHIRRLRQPQLWRGRLRPDVSRRSYHRCRRQQGVAARMDRDRPYTIRRPCAVVVVVNLLGPWHKMRL